ncbi:MAG: hypothetical protein D6744_09335 [Planctomycetota bacterium]|nr:MAG: hypothetical protein D6744_09335 [Planctomycetota bacterium]
MGSRKTNLLIRLTLLAVAAAAVLVWAITGRETLTKSARAVQVEVVDEVFGDTITETHQVPGPVFGYYLGLDLVVPIVLAAAGAFVVLEWLRRRPAAHRKAST